MKKMYRAVLLVSAAVACGNKNASTTPVGKAPMENSGSSTGGAAYGGATYGAARGDHNKNAPAGKDTPNPCAPR
jgi:hypothetical protein